MVHKTDENIVRDFLISNGYSDEYVKILDVWQWDPYKIAMTCTHEELLKVDEVWEYNTETLYVKKIKLKKGDKVIGHKTLAISFNNISLTAYYKIKGGKPAEDIITNMQSSHGNIREIKILEGFKEYKNSVDTLVRNNEEWLKSLLYLIEN